MRKRLLPLLMIALLLLPVCAYGAEENGEAENLLFNGDFSQYTESAALPAGWEFTAYDGSVSGTFVEEDEEKGTCVGIYSDGANDARIWQSVDVEPDACYEISCWIRTGEVDGGTGATLSVDNYDVDGTYCYSENIHGTQNWRTLAMYVKTTPEQTRLKIALRLGGYGTTASGEARYAKVAVRRCTETAGLAVIDLATENGTVSSLPASGSGAAEPAGENNSFTLILVATLLFGGAYLALYAGFLRYEEDKLQPVEGPGLYMTMLLISAMMIRVILSMIFYGHSTDINCFMAWGNAMLSGAKNFYTSGMFADYPPGYMVVCGGLAWVCKVLGIPYGSAGMALLFKLPATIADGISAYLLYRLAKKNGVSETFALVLAGLLAFNPVLAFVSGAWGQIDTLLTLLLVLVFYLFQEDKRIFAGAVYGVAILFKPQALMVGPLLAVAYIAGIFGKDWKKRLLETVLAVIAAVAVLLVLSLPFQGGQPWYWLIEKYTTTAGSYPYMSIEAFNFASLLGGNWKPIETAILGVPFSVWGTMGILLSVAYSLLLYCKGYKKSRGTLYLAGAVLIVLVFTLGHYMHERYLLPALLLLLVAYVYEKDRRLLIAFGGISASALLNVLCAMYIIDHQTARGVFYDLLTRVGSAAEVFSAIYLSITAGEIVFQSTPLEKCPRPSGLTRGFGEGVLGEFGAVPLRAVLPLMPVDSKLRYGKKDYLYVLSVTLVYGIVALTNLGSLRGPETYWEPASPGETVTVRFTGGSRHVTGYWVNGNIQTGGTLLLSTGIHEETFQQTYDDMFRWKSVKTDFQGEEVRLSLYSGGLKLNEIAFFDENGKRIPAVATDASGNPSPLMDEQDTVPEVPSYYNGMYFDELYHGRTAYEHLHNLAPYENSHPPLGKLLIMLGIAVFGMNAFGWRVVGALVGIAMLPVLYAFGKRLFKNAEYAFTATVLFAFDFMHFTQTRIATIDVYAVFFILLMYYYMYQYIQMNFFVDDLKKTYRPLFLSGLFFGIGAACKWTCIYAGAGLAVLLFGSLIARYLEYLRINRIGTKAQKAQTAVFWKNFWLTIAGCCGFFVVIPGLIYFASYAPYYIYEAGQTSGYGLPGMWKTFLKYQEFMYSYHTGLNATHPYQSPWYSWPFTAKPMWYYFNSDLGGAQISTLSASGSPAVWWVSAVGAVVLLGLRVFNRVKQDRALQVLCVGVLANYLPWVLVTRCTFIYHFFATVPFLLLSTVYLLQWFEKQDEGVKWVKWVWIGFGILFFLLMYPGISGFAVPADWAAFLSKLPGGKLMYGA